MSRLAPATPMLTDRVIVWFADRQRLCIGRFRRPEAGPRMILAVIASTSSDPERRRTRPRRSDRSCPEPPTHARSRAANTSRYQSPAGWPRQSLIAFSRSRSRYKTATGPGASCRESDPKVGDQRSPIVQTGQIVMLGEMAKPFFADDAGLELCEHGSRPSRVCVPRFRLPLPATALDEASTSRGQPPRDQRGGGHLGRRGGRLFRDPTLVSPVNIVCRVLPPPPPPCWITTGFLPSAQ